MATDNFVLMNMSEEDKLHAVRLLPIENKPFQRVSKHLLQPASQLFKRPTHLPSPPPDASEEDTAKRAAAQQREAEQREQWREEMILDFAALENTMVRIQLLQNSNELERQRYAKEKIHILDTQEAIKTNTLELRQQLEVARSTMEQRKKWDELADKIYSQPLLKSREEQAQMQEKLSTEIAEQEQEMDEYARLIAMRRQQMGVIGEGLRGMKGIIHPEEVDPESQEGTDGALTREANTPRPDMGDSTPMPNHDAEEGLKVESGSRSASRAVSLGRGDDIEMTEVAPTPVESSTGEIEEGEMET